MVSRVLTSLPVCALVLAAVDASLAAAGAWHLRLGAPLFLQTLTLWLAWGAVTLPLGFLLAALLERWVGPRGRWSPAAVGVATGMVWPVAAHARLDAFVDVGGGLGDLARPLPWLHVALASAVVLALAAVVTRALSRLSGRVVGVVAGLAAAIVGVAQPFASHAPLVPPGRTAEAPEDAPHLLLLVWDTTRSKSLSPYGYDRETTPRLAALAEESVLFEEARSASVFTLTSHLTMLTGAYPSHHGARLTRMVFDTEETPSIARMLHAAGYRTGGFVGTSVLRADTGVADGFEVYDDRVDPVVCRTRLWALVHDLQSAAAALVPALSFDGRPHWFQDFQAPADLVLERARAWIESDDDRPWFCFVNLYDVHWPYLPDEAARERWVRPYDGSIDGFLFRSDDYERPPDVERGSRLTAEDDAHLVDLYDGEMWELDARVGAFLDSLDASDRPAAIVMTSDHGEAFGEGGLYEHDDVLEAQVRVPLLVRAPGLAPERAASRAAGVDVAPTLLSLAGLSAPGWMRGLDLTRERPPLDRPVLVENRDRLRVREVQLVWYDGPWKLVQNGLGDELHHELFDLRVDPEALDDVAAEHPDVVARLAAAMEAERAIWGGDRETFDDAAGVGADHLRGLGYGGD